MRRTWPFLTVTAVVGTLAGVAIGGRPVANEPFVITADQLTTTTTTPPSTTTAPLVITTTTTDEAVETDATS